jgi:hypothetical protein
MFLDMSILQVNLLPQNTYVLWQPCADSGRFGPTEPVLLLDVSVIQTTELPLNVSVLQQP